MRDGTVSLPRQDWRLLLGPDPSHLDHRQAAETSQRGLRQLRHKVGLDFKD